MANWDAIAASAKRQIDSKGRSIAVIKQGSVPQDSDKPWEGQADYNDATVTGKGVFVPPAAGLGRTAENDQNTKRVRQQLYFAAADDNGEELEFFDLVQDGAILWKIDKAEVLSPAETRLLYRFEVSR